MIEGVFATGVPFGTMPGLGESLKDMARLMPQCAGVRRWGAAALDLAYVAAGRFDGYWERGIKPWDVAAGVVLVREAGGFVNPLREGDPLLGGAGLIAANSGLNDPFLKTIRDV